MCLYNKHGVLYNEHGFDLLGNLGRRNILLSSAQEKFFAEQLSKKFRVSSDGRTGEPDIILHSLDRELECKLTSRHSSGAISFQTDYETLIKKGKLDYLYVIASKDFDKFVVLHYIDLNANDFRGLSNGSRGKSQMFKYKTIDRVNVLVGKMKNINDKNIVRINNRLNSDKNISKSERNKLLKSLSYWETVPFKYSFELEDISESAC